MDNWPKPDNENPKREGGQESWKEVEETTRRKEEFKN